MLQQFGGGKRWFAAGPLMATAEGAMRAQHNVTEYESQDERAQEVIAKELHVRRIYGVEPVCRNSRRI